MKAALVILAVIVLGLLTPLVVVITSRRMDRGVLARRGNLPLGETTPELMEYSRVRLSRGRWVAFATFLFALATSTAIAWVVSGSPIAGAGAFVTVIVMWSFSSLAFRVWVARKAPASPASPVNPPGPRTTTG